jgi:ribosome maturation factor RimP
MMKVEERVKELVLEKIVDRSDLFLVAVKMHGNGRLEVLVDGDQGISIQDCADISRHVGFHLEEESVLDHAYFLEVSSPGIDYPLTQIRQYLKNIGRNVEVEYSEEGNSIKKEGKLLEVNDLSVKIEAIIKNKNLPKGRKPAVEEVEIPFEHIITTKVLISFK